LYEYEISIWSDCQARPVLKVIHLNDYAAVRAGRKYADGKPFEVWRGPQCVYGDTLREIRAPTG